MAMSISSENSVDFVRVVVLYDTLDSGCRAKGYLDRLQIRSRGAVQFAMKLWRFDMIELVQGQDVHADNSTQAEMVIVTLQSGRALPPAVMRWLHAWAERRQVEDAALVLLQPPPFARPAQPLESLNALRAVAVQHGLSFQCEWEADPSEASRQMVADLRRREHALSPTMERMLDTSFRFPGGICA